MLIVFIGPPGSGKGTQAKRLRDHLNIPHLSTGESLREAKASGSALGAMAAQYIDQGRLVPDSVVLAIVEEKLRQPEFRDGCLFDGFPRTVNQARALDELLTRRGTPLTAVLELKAEQSELIARMLKRATLEGRPDDDAQTISHRMEVYRQQTAPVLDYYRFRGILAPVDAMGTPDEVFERIKAAADRRRPTSGAS
jgi:adenylate kinases